MLRFREETVRYVDYSDWNGFVNTHFGFEPSHDSYAEMPYDVVAVEEWGNDQEHAFDADGVLDDWSATSIQKFRESGGKEFVFTSDLLNYFVSEGILEPATYVIKVWW